MGSQRVGHDRATNTFVFAFLPLLRLALPHRHSPAPSHYSQLSMVGCVWMRGLGGIRIGYFLTEAHWFACMRGSHIPSVILDLQQKLRHNTTWDITLGDCRGKAESVCVCTCTRRWVYRHSACCVVSIYELYAKDIYIISFNPHSNPTGRNWMCYELHVIDEETKSQRAEVTWPASRSYKVVESNFKTRQPKPSLHSSS